MTSSRSNETLTTASYDVIKDPSSKPAVPSNQHRNIPPSSHRQAATAAAAGQDTYEYVSVNKPATASYANSGEMTARQSYEIDESVYNKRNDGGEYDLEQPTYGVNNGTSSAVGADDVYFDVVRNGDSHEFTAVTADVTNPNDDEEIYFKDSDAYEG